jgi:hypothetical protein
VAGAEHVGPSSVELTAEDDNIRLAHEFALERLDLELALRLAATLWVWWSRPNRQAYARTVIERTLALPGADEHALRPHVLAGLAFLNMLHGDMAQTYRFAAQVVELVTPSSDPMLAGLAFSVLGTALAHLGDVHTAEPYLNQALEYATVLRSRARTPTRGAERWR